MTYFDKGKADVKVDFSALVDPSTTLGAFVISVLASLIVGFFSGKGYVTKKKNVSRQKGSKNINIQDMQIPKD